MFGAKSYQVKIGFRHFDSLADACSTMRLGLMVKTSFWTLFLVYIFYAKITTQFGVSIHVVTSDNA